MNYKYDVWRKSDNCRIKSNDITFNGEGIWINDDIEINNSDIKVFIPFSNIIQVVKFEDEKCKQC